MTKKLEEFFNVDTVDLHESQYDNSSPPEVNTEVVKSEIEFALPTIRDLEASDDEMDELASIAQEKFQDLMDLGMNVEPRFSGVILQTASTLLGHAITAKTAKMDKKLKMVNLQLQKAKLDHQIRKDAGESEDGTIEGTGIVVDRATLLNEILAASKKTDS